MNKVVETYSWNDKVYNELVKAKKDRTIMAVEIQDLGYVHDVQKKESEGIDILEVTFEIIERI
jgi:hypothetical protein